MQKVKLVICSLAALSIPACSSIPAPGVGQIPTRPLDPEGFKHLSKRHSNATCSLDDKNQVIDCTSSGVVKGSWLDVIEKCESGEVPQPECQRQRNSIMNSLLQVVDYNYAEYEGNLVAGNAKRNFAFGTLGTAIGLADQITDNVNTLKILTAIQTFAGTTNTAVSKEFYFEQTIPALLKAMRSERAEQLANINIGLKSDYEKYPLSRGIREINLYFRAGTLSSAVIQLDTLASAAEAQARNKEDCSNKDSVTSRDQLSSC